MDDLKSNSELREEAFGIIRIISGRLEAVESISVFVTSPFLEPFTLALAIGEAIRLRLRFREIAPNHSPRYRALQLTHFHNLLDWTKPKMGIVNVQPNNIFDTVTRNEMLSEITEYAGSQGKIGDIHKIERGWAVSVLNPESFPARIGNFSLSVMNDDDINRLPPATQTGVRHVTAASPRIDAISAAVLKPSREKIKKHLESGGVLLNYESARKSGQELVPGDVVAVRDSGRFKLLELGSMSKKGRISCTVELLNGP